MNDITSRALLTWPALGVALVMFGSAILVVGIGDIGDQESDVQRAIVPAWRWLALANVPVSLLLLLRTIASMAETTIAGALPYVGEVIAKTHTGHVWAIRLPVCAALAAAAFIPARTRALAPTILIASSALLLTLALSSHAIDHGALAVAVYFVHVAAAGAWLGAIATLALGAYAGADPTLWIARITPQVSRISAWAVLAFTASGLVNAWNSLGLSFDLLIHSLYGRTLALKVITVGTMLLIGLYNRQRLVPAVADPRTHEALVRNVLVECVLGAAILGWTALLANSPPPH